MKVKKGKGKGSVTFTERLVAALRWCEARKEGRLAAYGMVVKACEAEIRRLRRGVER